MNPRSPLGLVTEEPLLHDFVGELSRLVAVRSENPDAPLELLFSKARLREVRRAFGAMILRGEEKLHRFSELLCAQWFTAYQLSSVVVGQVDATRERFVLSQSLSAPDLYSTSDIDLGNRQINKLRFRHENAWTGASLVANFVEYQPTEPNPLHIHKLISRIKAEEEIWNKVVDEIFHLDQLVERDKQMSHLSYFVKDVFGLKVVVDTASDIDAVYQSLTAATFPAETLWRLGVQAAPNTERVTIIETKDYTEGTRKESGWEALKFVVSWSDKTFEIQVQPLRNYFRERERLTQESHAAFKARRETLRDEIAERMPIFAYCRALLRWLFVDANDPMPLFPGVTVRLVE